MDGVGGEKDWEKCIVVFVFAKKKKSNEKLIVNLLWKWEGKRGLGGGNNGERSGVFILRWLKDLKQKRWRKEKRWREGF